MKKRILILLAVLVFSLSLFSCRKDEADHVVDSVINVASSLGDSELGKLVSSDISSLRVSFGFDDLEGVKKYAKKFGVDTKSIPDISDAKADFYFNFKDAKLVQTAKAVVEGDNVEASAYEDTTNFVIKSNLVDKVYGAQTQTAVSWVGDEGTYEQVCRIAAISTKMFGTYGKVANNFIDNQMKELLRKNVEFETKDEGKNVVINCVLTEKELDAIFEELSRKQKKPEGTFAPLADVFDGADVIAECEFVILEKNSTLLSMVIDITSGGEKAGTISYKYDTGKSTFELSVISADENSSATLKGKLGEKSGGEYELAMHNSYKSADWSSETELVISAEASDGILKMKCDYKDDFESETYGNEHDELKFSVKSKYEINETVMKLVVLEIGYGGFITVPDIDELIGLTIEIEKNPEIPKAPEKYEAVNTPTELKTKFFYELRDNLDEAAQPLFNRFINMFFI